MDQHAPTPPPPRTHRPDPARNLRTALLGLLVNTVLAAAKLAAGILGNSYALVADALESFTDIVASLITSAGLRYAARPPDEEHPYGHGRAESIAALVVSAMLFAAGVVIAVQAVREIRSPGPGPGPAPFTLWVLIAVVAIKEGVYRRMRRVARDTGSPAVAADAWHHRADAVTSAAAAIGISVALIGGEGYESADDWAALAAAGIVLFNAAALLLSAWHDLMDRQSPALLARVRAAAEGVPGVAGVEKLHSRRSGSADFIDMHLHVDPDMTVHDAHALSGRVKAAVRDAVPSVANVLIHVEPAEQQGEEEETEAQRRQGAE